MNVKLISLTSHPVYTPEELIVYCARVSNPENQDNMKTSSRLLRYCMKHGHWSVFEMADMTLEIVTSRAISAQIIRHRSFSFQEFSQRYAEATEFEPVELREQAKSNRQSSSEVVDEWRLSLSTGAIIKYLERAYTTLLAEGVARECARMILPLCTQTTLYMKGSVRSWIHYFQQRRSEHTQKEHREIASAAFTIFKEQFPVIAESLEEVQG